MSSAFLSLFPLHSYVHFCRNANKSRKSRKSRAYVYQVQIFKSFQCLTFNNFCSVQNFRSCFCFLLISLSSFVFSLLSLACFHVFVEFPCRFSRDFELFWGVWLRHENVVVCTSVLLKLFALELSCNMCSSCTRVCVCVRVCSNSKSANAASAATVFFDFSLMLRLSW